ncbi:hypothetical protein [Beijerinckia indica]|uniref:Uncharacterized protein n=1 Tax=Beijerinckia indica subsp. indica (strain ATCC 9039 / DSM 1715 / NCIMB 8712) TaxID=395963 RepID=B2IDT3_BEII9|nr:hypothetical protein [Beijerinckia indica]ACB96865.1 hypothetical protein Bind_3306 [Beijerinckia indica subsp. indica ATCC 9039]
MALTRFTLFVALSLNLAFTRSALADPLVLTYHGWNVVLTHVWEQKPKQTMIDAIERQLDIVDHVGLKPDILQCMRAIRIVTSSPGYHSSPAHYKPSSGVDIHAGLLDPHKPIILHELLHALHDRCLRDGFNNQDIKNFFESGKAEWPAGSYLLTNNREFFAVTASVYLSGNIPRPPYSRAELHSKQPLYYQWLAKLFDNGHPRS